jgi:formylglycine-generating enzyme required for sulfatase activity
MLTDSGPADMVKVFISYSHDDKKYCDQIKKSLAQLQQCGKSIDVWADHEIKAGEEWDESIEEKLRQADIILFLVSISFIASPYIKDKELAVGYERREGGSAEIIPVLLSASMWEQTGLARFQALPIDPSDKRSKPIEDWDNKSQAYNSIALAIDDIASNILKNKQVREINEKLQFYKKRCQEFLSQSPDLELSIANQHSLNDLCEDLGIGKVDAEKVFEEAEKPFRVLKKNRERYLITVKAYLSDGSDLSAAQTQKQLKDRQLALRLEDGDISALQPEIDRLTEEQRAKEEEEGKAREEEAKRKADAEAEAARLAEEQRAKEEEDRRVREEEAKRKADAERLAEEQRAKEEEDRRVREEEAKRKADAERLAEEQRAKEEEDRRVREEEAKRKADAERLAEEQRAKEEAERRVREEEARRGPTLIQISADRGALVRVGNEWQQKTERITVSGYEQELAKGLAITMVQIPAGSFQMGSPDTEAGRASDEGPQHRVQLQSFFLGQTPVNQAQWKEVASWPQVNLKLNPDPANFKGANRPVEQVSWEEAMEFCRRLSQRTNLFYTLPSEAQWEYACRAGTTTPFAFGDTLTPDIANYDGNSAYGSGPKGQYREETTDVGSFAANAWGLQDMHGNLWEWCLDHWHYDYRGAPDDGSAWVIGGDQTLRLLRGGSWSGNPRSCRSAHRYWRHRDVRLSVVGFRLCRFPPGLVS